MSPPLAAAALGLLAAGLLEASTAALASRWAERGIRRCLPLAVGAVLRILAAAATAAALAASPAQHSLLAAAAAATAAWLLLLAAETDLCSRLIPKEACWAAAAAGTALAVAARPGAAGAVSVAVVLIVVVLPLSVVNKARPSMFGYGDVRLLAAVALCAAWWTGGFVLLHAVIAACLIQIAARAVLAGRDRLAGRPVQRRRELAFAPAIAAGTSLAVGYAASNGVTACADFVGLLGC